MKQRSTALIFWLAALIFFTPALEAQVDEVPEAPQVHGDSIGDLVLFGGRAAQLASSTTTITQEDLLAWSVKNLGQALSMITGTYVTSGRIQPLYQQSGVSLRGVTPQATKIILDGVPIGPLDTSAIDVAQIPIDNVAMIQIIRGPSSALFGGDTAGGVISIITRRAPAKVGSDFMAEYGLADTFEYRLATGGGISRVRGSISAAHQQADGWQMSQAFGDMRNENGSLRDNAEYRQDHYAGKIGVDLGEYADLQFHGSYYQAEREIPADQVIVAPRYLSYPLWQRWQTALYASVKAPKWFSANAKAYAIGQGNKLSEFEKSGPEELLESRLIDRTQFGGELLAFFDLGKWSLIKLRTAYYQVEQTLDLPGIAEESFVIAQHGYSLEWEMAPIEQLHLLLGGSWDIFEGVNNDRGLTGDDLQHFGPVAGITYIALDDLSFTLSYANKYRAPTLTELYSDSGANFDLQNENSQQAEFIARWAFPDIVAVRVSGFWQQVSSVIRMADPMRRSFKLDNLGDQQYLGAESEINITPIEGLLCRIGYTFVLAEELWDGVATDHVPFAPNHRAYGDVRYRFSFGLGLGYQAEYHSDFQYADDYGEYRTLDGYFLNNARIFYNYKGYLETYIYVTNILDSYYEKTVNYSEAGRRIAGGLIVRF